MLDYLEVYHDVTGRTTECPTLPFLSKQDQLASLCKVGNERISKDTKTYSEENHSANPGTVAEGNAQLIAED